ncbi:N-6 DNA methylase [Candidatus Nanosalina sp. VS9-1]|uniref:type I restriction-modification system subunit M n=1 Tax=Candidatus Nanosalina sp. VS9-1 TaxID=3388566 RepID=UPI0039E01AE1
MALDNGDNELEDKLWESATKLRGPVPSTEYRDIVLGLLFQKYMSDAFEERQQELKELMKDEDSDYYTEDEEERKYILNDKDEYYKENVFFVPEQSRWDYLVKNATQPDIGKKIDDAMRGIMEENPELQGMLPTKYERSRIPTDSVEGLLNLFADLDFSNGKDENGEAKEDHDLLGRVYEYFIKKFAKEEGSKGGEFYTPKSVVETMVEILEPYEGRLFDPFCGSGGMFIQSQNFLHEHGKDDSNISIYGQEIKEDTWKICQMNLLLRGMDGEIKLGDSIRDDQHQGLKADRIITNPPFNMEDWGKSTIPDDDPRFKYGMPPSNNANYAFMQHMINHLDEDDGMAATVMANGAMSVQGQEGEIREEIIEDDLFDAVIALPKELFFTTSIPACIFVLSRGKDTDQYRDRENETLFIDAREMYESVDRTQNVLKDEHINKIAETVRAYRGQDEAGEYEDEKGFCKVAETDDIADNRYIVTPGRYVGVKEKDGDDEPFEQKMERLSADLRENFQKSNELQEKIEQNLEEIGF